MTRPYFVSAAESGSSLFSISYQKSNLDQAYPVRTCQDSPGSWEGISMMTRENRNYHERIRKVCDCISRNLDDDLSLNRLSAVAAFSKYHFHRLFAAYTGQTLRDHPCLFRHLSFVHEVDECDLVTYVYLPLNENR
ncbi:MAG: AraC family transcriptional regulator [Sedimenticola sp.]|nr:AraC family transcriptional regulator [Sedimenticola sp.]